jgi:hypothetical protein
VIQQRVNRVWRLDSLVLRFVVIDKRSQDFKAVTVGRARFGVHEALDFPEPRGDRPSS